MQKETWPDSTGIADPLFRIILPYCYSHIAILPSCYISLGFHTTHSTQHIALAHAHSTQYSTATPCWLPQQHLRAWARSAIERGWTGPSASVPLVPDISPCSTRSTPPSGRVTAHSQRMTAPVVAQPTTPAIGLCSSPDLIDSPPIAPTHVPSTTSPTIHPHLPHYSLRLRDRCR